jgi:hypothetical protein
VSACLPPHANALSHVHGMCWCACSRMLQYTHVLVYRARDVTMHNAPGCCARWWRVFGLRVGVMSTGQVTRTWMQRSMQRTMPFDKIALSI